MATAGNPTANADEPRRTLRRVVGIVLWVCLGAVGLLVVARVLQWTAGPLFFLVSLLPYAALGSLLGAVLAAVLRRWGQFVVAFGLAAVIGFWWLPVFVADDSPVAATGHSVLALNLQFGRADPDQVAALAAAADVVLLVELTEEARRGLQRSGLQQRFPFHFSRTHDKAAGSGIWSRYPLADTRETHDLVFENVAARVEPPEGTAFTAVAVHAMPPSPTNGDQGRQINSELADFLIGIPGPVVAGGDFNATRDHPLLRDLAAAGYVDGADSAGAGFLRTWATDMSPVPPLVGIDHVLTRDLPGGVTDLAVVDVSGTDHRAVLAEF